MSFKPEVHAFFFGPQGAGGNSARRLFDRELDNQHEEPLLLSQLAAKQLRCLFLQDLTRVEKEGFKESNGEFRGSFEALQSWLVSSSVCLSKGALGLGLLLQQSVAGGGSSVSNWAGGLANHPSAFPFLFRCLLPFWAVPSPSMAAVKGVDRTAATACDGLVTTQQVLRKCPGLRQALEASLSGLCSKGILESGPLLPLVVAVSQQWGLQLHGHDFIDHSKEDLGSPLFLL